MERQNNCNNNYCNTHDLEYFHDIVNSVLFNNEQCGLILEQAIAVLQQAIALYEQGASHHKECTKEITYVYEWLDKCGSQYNCNVFTPKCEEIAQNVGIAGVQIVKDEGYNIANAKQLLEQWMKTSAEIDNFDKLLQQNINCVHGQSQNNNCNCNCNCNKKCNR